MSLNLSGPTSGHFYAGNDHEWEFTVTDSDGNAVDISGMTFRFVMQRPKGATSAALSTEDSPATATASEIDAESGKFKIAAGNTDTAGLSGHYLYQAQVEDLSGKKSNVLHGFFTFDQNIIP